MESFSLQSFHALHGNLFHDFQNAVFRVLPVMGYKWSEDLLAVITSGDFLSNDGSSVSLCKGIYQF